MAKTRKFIDADRVMLNHLEEVQSRLAGGGIAALGVASVDLLGHAEYWYLDPAIEGKLGILDRPLSELLVLYRTNAASFDDDCAVPYFNKSRCEH